MLATGVAHFRMLQEVVAGLKSLSASAAEGFRFSHWSGDIRSEENPTILVMDAAKEVNAHFAEASAFAWWWVAAGLGVVAVALSAYFLMVRRVGWPPGPVRLRSFWNPRRRPRTQEPPTTGC